MNTKNTLYALIVGASTLYGCGNPTNPTVPVTEDTHETDKYSVTVKSYGEPISGKRSQTVFTINGKDELLTPTEPDEICIKFSGVSPFIDGYDSLDVSDKSGHVCTSYASNLPRCSKEQEAAAIATAKDALQRAKAIGK
jgi:hypothetical protein